MRSQVSPVQAQSAAPALPIPQLAEPDRQDRLDAPLPKSFRQSVDCRIAPHLAQRREAGAALLRRFQREFRRGPKSGRELATAYGVLIVRTDDRLSAVAADAVTAATLGVAQGAPLLQIDRIAYGLNDAPVEWRMGILVIKIDDR